MSAELVPAPVNGAAMDECRWRWAALRDSIDSLRGRLVEQRLLPESLKLDLGDLGSRLSAGTALLMVAPRGQGALLAVVALGMGDGRLKFQHAEVRQGQDARTFSCATLARLARQAIGSGRLGKERRLSAQADLESEEPPAAMDATADADQFALDVFRDIWQRTVWPLEDWLAARGCVEVCLIPSDELHLLPWSHLSDAVASSRGLPFIIYPDVGAWHRTAVPARPPTVARPRWAIASWSAADTAQPLPWVEVEAALARRLWHEADRPVVNLLDPLHGNTGADSLLCIGHGAAPDGNPAHTGLALGGGVVLTTGHLPAMGMCRQVLLSACVLGRLEDAFGETLGFLSNCFDRGTQFGFGWLVEVPDLCACLASLAFQFEVRRAHDTAAGRSVDWRDVLRRTRLTILGGRWPDGFPAWLEREMPSALDAVGAAGHPRDAARLGLDRAAYLAPPPQLLRVMPWLVALGR